MFHIFQRVAFLLLFVAVFSVSLEKGGAIVTSGAPGSAKAMSSMETYRLLNLFGDVFAKTRHEYIDPVSDKELIEKALNGMLSSLDPHSRYVKESEYRGLKDGMKGAFGGIGIELIGEHGVIKIISPIDDTPAFRAGLMPGDFIVEVDGEPVLGFGSDEIVDKMRGKPGSEIDLKIVREGQLPFNVHMKRELIKVEPVRWKLFGDVGYIRVSTFVDEKTGQKVLKALKEIRSKLKEKFKGIILDLRNNPGGLVDQAVEVAGVFLGNKEVVSMRGRATMIPKRYFSDTSEVLEQDFPVVVLINSGTASAPEIVAGALKDHKRAVIMGVRSFGKGSVQTVFPVPGRGAMLLTTDLYYTPSGKVIQANGVEPDITVEPGKVELVQYSNFREEDMPKALLSELKGSGRKKGKEKRKQHKKKMTSDDKIPVSPLDLRQNEEKDFQIQRALDLVQGLSLWKSIDLNKSSNSDLEVKG